MDKKLYQITEVATRKPVPGLFFADKAQAKSKRKELNNSDPEKFAFIVSPGPDHNHYSTTKR